MANVSMEYIASGKTDAADRLLEADGRLAELNRACGGEFGSTLAIPQLLSLVTKAREYGLRLSRWFEAVNGRERITAWASGCREWISELAA